eukprot:705727-Amphidinium_carterae.1
MPQLQWPRCSALHSAGECPLTSRTSPGTQRKYVIYESWEDGMIGLVILAICRSFRLKTSSKTSCKLGNMAIQDQ